MKQSVADLGPEQLAGRRALVRVDYNVPLDANGVVQDDTRVRATIPTLRALRAAGARPVLLSHLGRPKGKPDPHFSLRPVVPLLAELTGAEVRFVDAADSDEAADASVSLTDEQILLLENTRFLPGETSNACRQTVESCFAHRLEALEHHGGSTEHCLERRNHSHRGHGILDEHAFCEHDVKGQVDALFLELVLHPM